MTDFIYNRNCSYDDIPYTTSKIIADATQLPHKVIKERVRHYLRYREVDSFPIFFEDTRGGKRSEKNYCLDEYETFVVLSHLRKNADVKDLEIEIGVQFSAMNNELENRRKLREEYESFRGMRIRETLFEGTDEYVAIRYSNLAYSMAFGRNKVSNRAMNHFPHNGHSLNYMKATELDALITAEYHLIMLAKAGLDYKATYALVTGITPEEIDVKIAELNAPPPVSVPVERRGRVSTLWHKFISFFRAKTAEPPDNTDAGDNAA